MDTIQINSFWKCFLKNPNQYLLHIFDRKSFISAMITAFYVCSDDLLTKIAKANLDVRIPPSNGYESGLIGMGRKTGIEVSSSTGELMFYTCNRRIRKNNGEGSMLFVKTYFKTLVKNNCYSFSPSQFVNSLHYLNRIGTPQLGAKGLIYSSTSNSCYMDSLFMTLIYMKSNDAFAKQLFRGKAVVDFNALSELSLNNSSDKNKEWVDDLTSLLYMLNKLTLPSKVLDDDSSKPLEFDVSRSSILYSYFGSVDYNDANVKLALRVLRETTPKLSTKLTSYTKFIDLKPIAEKFLDIFPNMIVRITKGKHKGKNKWDTFSLEDIYSKLTDIYPGLKLTYKFRDISDETSDRNFVYKDWDKQLWNSYSVNYEHFFKDQIAFLTHPPFIVFTLLTTSSNKFLSDNGFRWKLEVNTVKYDLQGIIIHSGNHYYAFIKTLYFGWIRSDSTQMSLAEMDEIEVVGKANAKLLFYCKL